MVTTYTGRCVVDALRKQIKETEGVSSVGAQLA